MSHGKRPSFQFYPKDWLSDPKLRSCSAGARGIWVDLMCVMHSGEPYGHLALDGKPIPDPAAARLVGESLADYRRFLKELEGMGVSSRTESGVLYSRRMVRDEEIRNIRAAVGSVGGRRTVDRHRDPSPSHSFAQANGQHNPKQTGQQSEQQMVAAAAADADAEVVKGKREKLRGRLPEDSRDAFDALLRASHNPQALVGELEMIAGGAVIPGATWQHIGAALRDLSLSGQTRVTGKALRAFVRGAMREDVRLVPEPVDEFTALERKLSRAG